jgi:hypothetical protein
MLDSHIDDYLAGVQFFNQQQYWLAHEAWEVCWLAAQEPDRSFFRGIIQVSAALVQWQRRNVRGTMRNYAKARPHLVAVSPQMHGLDVAALIVAMDRFLAAGAPPDALPTLRLADRAGDSASPAGFARHTGVQAD